MKTKIIIMGAAGRDFHNYNTYFRDNSKYDVVAFTAATQIPNIDDRIYPKEIAHTMDNIPIYPEKDLAILIKHLQPEQVILAYSDLPHQEVMNKASLVLSLGCDFRLMGPETTMLKSIKPVIAITAVRTGCGKSGVSKEVAKIIKEKGLRVVVIRHPMPYDQDLNKQVCQRFATMDDLDKHHCTIEEREEYEQYVNDGFIIYAGVDYSKILEEAEKEADIIIWDGGNNDIPFFKPDYHICVVDALRPGHEMTYYPGQVNLRMADMIIINKVNSVKIIEDIDWIKSNIKEVNPNAIIIESKSLVSKFDIPINSKVIIVEDGPSLTHGETSYGAGYVAVMNYE